MIKINNLHKYYNKNKSNEIHVLDNINLNLPDSGFISILGASGSGKSTLLNVIGGLDSYDSGNIEYIIDNKTIDNQQLKKEVGFIFQNYLLHDNKTIYYNLKEVLEIDGIYDKQIIDKRIKYVLSLVNLSHYEKKKCNNLSGGQKQRVAIARALLHNSRIILADEPTGNLDSENTIEILNILKLLSTNNHTLVLLVTHEENACRLYSDLIINFKDGKILDIVKNNTDVNNYEIKSNNAILLKDYEKESIKINSLHQDFNLDVYTDNSINLSDMKFIIKNNTLYISSPIKTINVNDNNIKLLDSSINDYKKEIDKKTLQNIDLSILDNNNIKKHKANFFKNFINVFKEIFNGSKMSKFLRWVFLILGGIASVLIITYSKYEYVDQNNVYNLMDAYTLDNVNYYDSNSINKILTVWNNNPNNINDLLPIKINYLNTKYQTNFIEHKTDFCSCYSTILDDSKDYDLYLGRLPEKFTKNVSNKEVVIGKKLYDSIIKRLSINGDIELDNIKTNDQTTIVGVLNDDTNLMYYNSFQVE